MKVLQLLGRLEEIVHRVIDVRQKGLNGTEVTFGQLECIKQEIDKLSLNDAMKFKTIGELNLACVVFNRE